MSKTMQRNESLTVQVRKNIKTKIKGKQLEQYITSVILPSKIA